MEPVPAWVLLAVAVAYGPHLVRLPWWVSAGLAAGILWAWAAPRRGLPVPPRPVRWALSLGALALVVASHGRTFALDAGTELMGLGVGLKFLEARSRRDAVLLLLVAYLLAATHVLAAQHLGMALWMLASAVLTTAALASLETPRPWQDHLRLAAGLVALALPVAALAFVVIPRLPSVGGGLPVGGAAQGVTGLADTVRPGSLGAVAQSAEIALRVAVDGDLPPRGRWYWRAVVLDEVDGEGGWSRRREAPVWSAAAPPRWQGRVTLEPHGLPWLVTLDWPVAAPAGARLDAWGGVRRSLPVRERLVYPLASGDAPPPWDGAPAWTSLPPGLAPRARAVAQGWQHEGAAAVARRALDFFATGGFRYTLEPRPAVGDPVDGFLFGTREGFCEHYASALAVLLRAAGIPARVVAGYLGGEVNPVTGHITVRQADAHAWVEAVLDPAQGWQRLDPTLAVAPERAERGLAAGVGSVAPRQELRGLAWLRLLWDAADHAWTHAVLDFTAQRQRTLWRRLLDWLPAAGVLAGAAAVLLAVVRWWRAVPRNQDPACAALQDLCRWLARQGVSCRPWEGPRTLRQRLVAERPDLARAGELLGQLERLRYGEAPDAAALRALRREIRLLPRSRP